MLELFRVTLSHTNICNGKDVLQDTTTEPTIQQLSINVGETPDETSIIYLSQHSHDILLKTAIAPVIYNNQK